MAVCIYWLPCAGPCAARCLAHKVTRLVPGLVLARGCAQAAHKLAHKVTRTRYAQGTHKVRTRYAQGLGPNLVPAVGRAQGYYGGPLNPKRHKVAQALKYVSLGY